MIMKKIFLDVKYKIISNDAFITDACQRCLCVMSDKTEMAKEKEYLLPVC